MLDLNNFIEHGFGVFPEKYSRENCNDVLKQVSLTRSIDAELFLSQEEYLANPTHKGVNPEPGRNLTEKISTDFIDKSDAFNAIFSDLLGSGFEILNKKFVAGVPEEVIPKWILEKTVDELVPNLGAYIRPEYRDMTYFHGIDFHQDLIDFKGGEPDFVTYYVYLDKTTLSTSPLTLVPGSHKLGPSTFPHNLKISDQAVNYRNGDKEALLTKKTLTGDAGESYYWHALLLHGTQPQSFSLPRVSLRYLIKKNLSSFTDKLSIVNNKLSIGHSLKETRLDLDAEGLAAMRGNKINKIKLDK